ncbi:MAG: MoxR family ATPase [Firmicutes bacterium]|jgi:MoxR-like ATPase|uniref:MoxR family ATPase n=1 Tax=Sulfobacillus benefaciens TaxID=453960 RepID=A0A2T2WVS3_9FIRM|nr:MoxR family ATPase [Bacillota bacterium]MCL5013351.1 MoxR family ATPase [Bacillota bacterium]PSR26339.1 MAG: MoxR family ATPase [Sulfobacillus benefaciens]
MTILTPDAWKESLVSRHYIPTPEITIALSLAQSLEKPLLVEGPPGAGKTFLARTAAHILEASFIRLQCYEGIDASQALYEYHYAKQLLYINALREPLAAILGQRSFDQAVAELEELLPLWGRPFLTRRPVLEALDPADHKPRVLLIDEIDRADREFEALLLEPLSEFSLSIPEFGTIQAVQKPLVILTSNRSRELSDALRRRCLYVWIELPDRQREAAIIQSQVPQASESFAKDVAEFLASYRHAKPHHLPSIAEAVELATALCLTGENPRPLTPDNVDETLPIFAKHPRDMALGRQIAERKSRP